MMSDSQKIVKWDVEMYADQFTPGGIAGPL